MTFGYFLHSEGRLERVELGNLELGSLPQKMANNIDSSASLVSDGMQMSILSMGVEFTLIAGNFARSLNKKVTCTEF